MQNGTSCDLTNGVNLVWKTFALGSLKLTEVACSAPHWTGKI